MSRCPLTIACVAVAAAIGTAKQTAPKDTADTVFKVAVQAKMTMKLVGEEKKIVADTQAEYRWKRVEKVRTLIVESVEVRVAENGQDKMNGRMSRAGFADVKGGKTVKTEDAPEQLKKLLTDSFGSPLCKIELDDTGREVKRTIIAGPGATPMIATGMISHASIFHPWYSADKNDWQAEMEASTGNGYSASGKVTYTKIPGGKGGQAVKVAGTLSAEGAKASGGLVFKEAKYIVKGEQTYDTRRKEWIAGKLTMDLSFTLTDGKQYTATATGEMVLTLEVLPDKK